MSLSLKALPLLVSLVPFALSQSSSPPAPLYASGPFPGQHIPWAVATGKSEAAWTQKDIFTPAQLSNVADFLAQPPILTDGLARDNIVAYFPAGAAVISEDKSAWDVDDDATVSRLCSSCPVKKTDQAISFDENNADWSTLWTLAKQAFDAALVADPDNNLPTKLVTNFWTNDQMSPPNPLCVTVKLEALQRSSQTLLGNMKQDLHDHFQKMQQVCKCDGLNAFGGGTKVLMRGGLPRWRMSMQPNGASCVPW